MTLSQITGRSLDSARMDFVAESYKRVTVYLLSICGNVVVLGHCHLVLVGPDSERVTSTGQNIDVGLILYVQFNCF